VQFVFQLHQPDSSPAMRVPENGESNIMMSASNSKRSGSKSQIRSKQNKLPTSTPSFLSC